MCKVEKSKKEIIILGMKTNKKVKIYAFLLIIFLIAILLNFYIYVDKTTKFNKRLNVFRSSHKQTDVILRVSPRMGESGSWLKRGVVIDGKTVDLKGTIYDITLNNYTDAKISDWNLKINIMQDCYINNAWCGTVEIHQNVASGQGKVQTLDMRKLSDVNIELENFIETQDMMIPLHKGDYLIYHPGINQNEMPVFAFNGAPGSATVGMIFYYSDSLSLNNFELSYFLQKKIMQGLEYDLFRIFLVLWIILVISLHVYIFANRKNEKELRSKVEMLEESLDLISHFVDAKDPYTQGHSHRVAEYSEMIAQKMGMSSQESRYVYYAGILHDVGKCYVPDNVLKKPGKLTDEEFDVIKSHTNFGAEMLSGITSIPGISDGAKYHHEKYNGRGYPVGLSGTSIPLIARIICVADSFDAMNSSRCYRKKLTKEYILEEIEKNKGTQFDPKIADVLLELISDGKILITNDC